ncbi:MAG TPA: hypothetical protein VH327_09405 [Gammaproteobacteria bacterium]|nr:hypothetical protein [Gammaproteobacteria bacterium]
MNWAWSWSGRCFGYWIDDDLWTYSGKHIGRRRGTHIHAPNGRYIGEIMSNGRLITNKAKAGMIGPIFVPTLARSPEKRRPDSDGRAPYTGHEDFPHPDEL